MEIAELLRKRSELQNRLTDSVRAEVAAFSTLTGVSVKHVGVTLREITSLGDLLVRYVVHSVDITLDL